MRRVTILALTILLLLPRPAPADISSPQEIRQLVDERTYAQALQKIAAALNLKGPAAKLVDRYDLWMLKAECHLQTKALPLAREAYASAAKEATTDTARAVAEAHVALLKAAKNFAYTPRTAPNAEKGRPSPIDLLDRESRRRAFAALFDDEQAAAADALKAARAAKALPPLAAAFKPLATLTGIELAAAGADGQTPKSSSLRTELTEKAKKVLADNLRDLAKRVGEISKDANTFVETIQDVYDVTPLGQTTIRKQRVWKKRGLTEPQTTALQDATKTCDQLVPGLPELARGLGVDEATFDPMSEEAARIRKDVDRVLDTDYMKTYRELPKK